MRIRRTPLAASLLVSVVAFASTAAAQAPPDLDALRAAARLNAGSAMLARSRADIADAERAAAGVPLRPVVRAGVAGEINDREISIDLPPAAGLQAPIIQPDRQIILDASVRAPLYDADAWARRAAADDEWRAQRFRAEAAGRQSERAAVELAFALDAADRAVEATAELLSLRRTLVADVRRRQTAGDASTYEVRRAEVAVAAAELDLSRAAEGRGEVARALTEWTGVDVAAGVDLRDAAPPDFDRAMVDGAADRRYEVRAAAADEAQAEALRIAARRTFVPDLVATGAAAYATAPAVDGEHARAQARLVLDIPLYDRGARRAALRQADALQALALAEQARTTAAAEHALGDALAGVETSQAALAFSVQRQALAAEALALAEAAWTAGEIDAVEVQRAQTEFHVATLQQVDAERAALWAQWSLWFAAAD